MTDSIRLAHGSGGKLTQSLIAELFLPYFSNPALDQLDDSALVQFDGSRVAFTTDSYVVDPLFFPGGDIGRLAVCGTVNDLAMKGARAIALSAGFIIEEGLSVEELRRVLDSMSHAAREANVNIVAGDTKVVAAGAADKLFINTSGVGQLMVDNVPSGSNAQPGDAIIVSGSVGDHGMAVLVSREGLDFETRIESDVAPLSDLVERVLNAGIDVHTMRDPTRGGLATTMNEIAKVSSVDIELEESAIPVSDTVRGACELLGFDPLYVANEGKLVMFVPEQLAGEASETLRKHPLGKDAQVIGSVIGKGNGTVFLKTGIGGRRILDMPVGEQLPRIC